MTVLAYTNLADNRQANKRYHLIELGGAYCEVKGESSIISPTFTLSGISDSVVARMNYIYIPDWQRFYYVTDIKTELGKHYTIECYVDAIMSFYPQIKSLSCFVRRQKNKYNNYIPDTKIPARDTRKYTYLEVGNMPQGAYYMSVNG